jgi:glycerophosphoryl diester phosphodiesterase
VHPYLESPLPLAFAHRGGAAEGDENTADAFGRAVALGYRYVETDTQATKDGVAVIFHDDTLERMLGIDRLVSDVTFADLRAARVGGAAVVPTLAEALDAWPQVRFNVDVKADIALDPALAAVERTQTRHRVLLASFSDTRLRRIRAACGPEQATSLSQREVATLWARSRVSTPRVSSRLPRAGILAAQVPTHFRGIRVVDRRFIRAAHALGLQVHVWTIDEPAEMRELLDLGVDGIMTDHIEVLRSVYADRGCWSCD